jgi:hypothetical protein
MLWTWFWGWLPENVLKLVIISAVFGGLSVISALWAGYAGHLEAVAAKSDAASANLAAGQANAAAGAANERAAALEKEAAETRERAAITEERLLNERRLTARERWQFERVERAILPRTQFVDWPQLVAELKAGHFPAMNLAYVNRPEPRSFALALMMAMQQGGVPVKLIELPAISGELNPWSPVSSSGAIMITADPEGDRLGQMLWQKFQIGGGATSVIPDAWAAIPKGTNCLVIEENNWAMSPGNGQPGEGIDKYGGPNPAPN